MSEPDPKRPALAILLQRAAGEDLCPITIDSATVVSDGGSPAQSRPQHVAGPARGRPSSEIRDEFIFPTFGITPRAFCHRLRPILTAMTDERVEPSTTRQLLDLCARKVGPEGKGTRR